GDRAYVHRQAVLGRRADVALQLSPADRSTDPGAAGHHLSNDPPLVRSPASSVPGAQAVGIRFPTLRFSFGISNLRGFERPAAMARPLLSPRAGREWRAPWTISISRRTSWLSLPSASSTGRSTRPAGEITR